MKKLMALIALVAMVAVSSVAFAQSGTVSVSGTVGSTLTVDDCTASFGTISVGSVTTAQCTHSYSSNASSGYTLTFAATNSTLDHDTESHTIDALTAADCTTQAAECFSYEWSTTDADGTTNVTGENAVPTGAGEAVYTGNGAGDVAVGETSTFDFNAWAESSTDAGTYSLTGGSLTVAAQ